MKLGQLIEMKTEKLYLGAWNKHGFPLDIIAT